MNVRRDLNPSVALLTNTVPPYRIQLFQSLRVHYSNLIILVDTTSEYGRQWNTDLSNLPVERIRGIRIPKFRAKYGQINISPALIFKLLRLKPHVIISSELGFRTLTAILYKLLFSRTSLVIWLGLSEHTEKQIGFVKTFVRRWMCDQAESIFVTGKSGLKYVESLKTQTYIVNSPQTSSLLNSSSKSKVNRHLHENRSKIRLLFVGPSFPRKNLKGLLKLLKESKHSSYIRDNFELTLLAVDSEEVSEDDKQIVTLKVLPFVQHHEMEDVYYDVDLLVFPTLLDEWGLIVNEALSLGCPVMGSIYSQASVDLLGMGGGWQFDPLSQSSFDDALEDFIEVWSNPRKYSALKKKARQVGNNFKLEDMSNNFRNSIEIALKQSVNRIEKRSVSIVIPYLNKYRQPFMESLQEQLRSQNIELKVFSGQPLRYQKAFLDEAEFQNLTKLRQLEMNFFGRKILFRILPFHVFKSDLIIYDQGLGHLDLYFAIFISKIMKRRFAFWGHGLTITKRTSLLYKKLQETLVLSCDWFFAYTVGSAQRVMEFGYDKSKISVLNNTIDFVQITDFESILKQRNQQQHWSALYLGALSNEKRINDLLEFIHEIRLRVPNFQLYVAGEGSDFQINEDLAREMKIVKLGFVNSEAKAALSRSCRVILNPARIGLLAIDSFSLGLPIVGLKDQLHGPEIEYLNKSNSFLMNNKTEIIQIIQLLAVEREQLEQVSRNCFLESFNYRMSDMVASFNDGINKCLKDSQ